MKGVLASQFVRYLGSGHKISYWKVAGGRSWSRCRSAAGILWEFAAVSGSRLPANLGATGVPGQPRTWQAVWGRSSEGAHNTAFTGPVAGGWENVRDSLSRHPLDRHWRSSQVRGGRRPSLWIARCPAAASLPTDRLATLMTLWGRPHDRTLHRRWWHRSRRSRCSASWATRENRYEHWKTARPLLRCEQEADPTSPTPPPARPPAESTSPPAPSPAGRASKTQMSSPSPG